MITKIKEMYIFDIDGVIASIDTHKIEEYKLLDFIIKILNSNEPVAFNTGRPLVWVKEVILSLIESKIENRSKLHNLFVVAEKGGAWIEYKHDGEVFNSIDKNIQIPKLIQDNLQKMVDEKFSGLVFYDTSKKTMATIEKSDNISMDEFRAIHPKLNLEIEKILENFDKDRKFKYVPTTLDTDIESKLVGKDYAVGKILEWLSIKEIMPINFITFGDSPSDAEMYRYLINNGHRAKFIYVGEKEILDQKGIIKTKEKFDKGTLEYLKGN